MSSNRLVDLASRQSEQAGAEIDVLAAGQLGVEAGAELDQRDDAARHLDTAARRPRHARDQLQQRRLAGAVRSDDAEARAFRDLEADVAEREHRRVDPSARGAVDVVLAPAQAIERRRDQIDNRSRSSGAIPLRDVIETDGDHAVSYRYQLSALSCQPAPGADS